jgi:hypothetical protein
MQGSTAAGANIGTNIANAGTALGGGQVAMGNAFSGAANQFGNYNYMGSLLNQRNPISSNVSGSNFMNNYNSIGGSNAFPWNPTGTLPS